MPVLKTFLLEFSHKVKLFRNIIEISSQVILKFLTLKLEDGRVLSAFNSLACDRSIIR